MKTDSKLNRLIAERALNWRFTTCEDGEPRWWTPDEEIHEELFDWCTDAAAWGALFVWLAKQGKRPILAYDDIDLYDATVEACDKRDRNEPGRALVLATLAAYGVEVE